MKKVKTFVDFKILERVDVIDDFIDEINIYLNDSELKATTLHWEEYNEIRVDISKQYKQYFTINDDLIEHLYHIISYFKECEYKLTIVKCVPLKPHTPMRLYNHEIINRWGKHQSIDSIFNVPDLSWEDRPVNNIYLVFKK